MISQNNHNNRRLALAVMIILPLLLLLQLQLPRFNQPLYQPIREEQVLDDYSGLSESANSGNPKAIAEIARIAFEQQQPALGFAYLKLGALEFEQPSLQLLYGDYCARAGKVAEARRAYSLALLRARKDGRADFAAMVAKRLESTR